MKKSSEVDFSGLKARPIKIQARHVEVGDRIVGTRTSPFTHSKEVVGVQKSDSTVAINTSERDFIKRIRDEVYVYRSEQ